MADSTEYDNFQRHVDEVALLQAMYPEDVFESEAGANGLTVTVRLGVTPVPVELRVLLPPEYPETRAPVVGVSCAQSSRRLQERLHDALHSIVRRLEGRQDEVLDEILAQFKTFLTEVDFASLEPSQPTLDDADSTDDSNTALVVVLWFHHLLSTTKRSDIVSLATAHRLSGISKPGYPGCLIVEGSPTDVHAYVAELRSWRWQGFQVRSEHALEDGRRMSEIWTNDAASHCWKGVVEVEKMADIVKALRPFELDQLFMRAMKLGAA
ncbi:hypothetical protein EXIGLDRAFT_844161 [Exidia glandulosa HHB12029]|uniref:RWD domain-containing protein n=1 Tax=Exidia glandulosa HHB12029 TaxID=1314781 RepID=A0A165ZEI4_EXIGL|nr:hypothetical protein EXIGLDRAFT_844161 [Exidia glandulosa HHB12029]